MKYLLFSVVLLISCAENASKQDKHKGVWNLHIIEYFDEDAQAWTVSEWMKGGDGILYYGDDGHMNVHFTPEDYRRSAETEGLDELDELLFDNALMDVVTKSTDYWYVGEYELSDDQEFVFHHRIMHSNPEDWGVTVKRKIDFLGDTLVLTSTERETNLRLKWVRR